MHTPEPLRGPFAKVLRSLRKKAKYTQEELAQEADLHPTYISQLERGLKSPTLETLECLANALRLSLVEFIVLIQLESKYPEANKDKHSD